MRIALPVALLVCSSCAALGQVFAAGQDAAPAEIILSEAQNEYNAGQYNRAVDALNAGVGKNPNDASLQFLLGQCYYQLQDYARATTSLERAVQLAGNNSQYHDWLGKAYGRRAEEGKFLGALGGARKAHKEFEQAVALDSHNFEAQRDLIRYETYAPGIAAGGDERALKDIEVLEKSDPIQGDLARGEFLNAKKRYAEADDLFAKILESKPDPIGVYFEVAEYYRDRQNATKMAEAVASAETIGPMDRRLPYYRGVLLVLSKEHFSEAEKLLKTYLATVPDNADFPSHASTYEWLGKLFEAQGKFSEGALEYRQSLQLDPHNKEVSEALRRVEKK